MICRAGGLRGCRVRELGSGTGLPGFVAASLGARVVQTSRAELAPLDSRSVHLLMFMSCHLAVAAIAWTRWEVTSPHSSGSVGGLE